MGTIQFFKLKLNKKKQHVIISVINFGRFLASNHFYHGYAHKVLNPHFRVLYYCQYRETRYAGSYTFRISATEFYIYVQPEIRRFLFSQIVLHMGN